MPEHCVSSEQNLHQWMVIVLLERTPAVHCLPFQATTTFGLFSVFNYVPMYYFHTSLLCQSSRLWSPSDNQFNQHLWLVPRPLRVLIRIQACRYLSILLASLFHACNSYPHSWATSTYRAHLYACPDFWTCQVKVKTNMSPSLTSGTQAYSVPVQVQVDDDQCSGLHCHFLLRHDRQVTLSPTTLSFPTWPPFQLHNHCTGSQSLAPRLRWWVLPRAAKKKYDYWLILITVFNLRGVFLQRLYSMFIQIYVEIYDFNRFQLDVIIFSWVSLDYIGLLFPTLVWPV